ncbi:MAG TPA: hypothetical protein VKQ36_01920 [Ktedonobacterales bacterium]|nr:hypothetical protein [Ktedonobacterales bacterium]
MSIATTIFHAQTRSVEEVERALEKVFKAQNRPSVTRLEGTFSAVLARALDPNLAANYRYVICRPHPQSGWTPIIELGVRTVGLEARLSHALGGAAVFTVFVYGDGLSGYRLARNGVEVDRYTSDPTYLLDNADIPTEGEVSLEHPDPERERGHPERFADLLPEGTAPEDVTRVVLAPGWWERHDAEIATASTKTAASTEVASEGNSEEDDEEEIEEVDEIDRLRCIALALELWGPDEYPFAQELEDIPNKLVGPALLLGFA